jgi:lipoprotein-anchoring transpeptidase ErfK/SrfK
MARSRRARASRTLIAFVVLAIAVGAAIQFHRLHKSKAPQANIAPATQPVAAPVVAVAPSPKPVVPVVPVSALVTQTPGAMSSPSTRPVNAALAANLPNAQALTTWNAAASPAQANVSAHPLTDAKTKADAGDLISARKTLNDALLAGNLSAADTASVKKQISQINQTLVFSTRRFPDDPFGGVESVKPGQRLSSIASEHDVTWQLLMRLNGLTDPRKLRSGQNIKIIKGPFHVVVTKGKFNMDVYLGSPGEAGSMYITSYGVGLGTDNSTPTGTWMVEPQHKVRHPTYYSPRGEGVIQADDPKNPLGPFWIGLAGTDGHAVGKQSYGIHGTIDPASIGTMSSMGCIRMHNEDVAIVFELLVEGKSTVIVKD